MKKSNSNLNEFYLDVSRYTFDYLFDIGKRSFIIELNSKNERKMMSSLFRHAFISEGAKRSDHIMLKMSQEGITASYVDKKDGISFEEYVRILFSYAKQEDKKIEHLTQSKLFENIIESGFSNLGLRKDSSLYCA